MNKNDIDTEQQLQFFIGKAIQIVGGVAELAQIAKVSERTVYAWRNGERYPSRGNLRKVTEYLQEVTDHSELTQTNNSLKQANVTADQSAWPDEFIFVEKAEAKPSAGGGSLETSGDSLGSYAFRLNWVLRKSADTSRLKLMEVAGRSMENTLHNGDLVLINEQDCTLVEDRIYVIRVQDEIYVKRFSRTPGQYLFLGDNRDLDYQDIHINLDEDELNWEVIGRVIWAGKEF